MNGTGEEMEEGRKGKVRIPESVISTLIAVIRTDQILCPSCTCYEGGITDRGSREGWEIALR